MGRTPLLALLGALAIVPRIASAQSASDQDKALAATLFDDGRVLLAAGKVPEACRKLEESRRLDPLPGTVLNLAACHEREGLMASAMAEFREARAMAAREQRNDRVAFADDHLKAIMPKLSMVVIVVPPEADLPALTVLRDGIAIGRAVWGTRIPVDPGSHVIEASAPGKQLRHVEVKVGPDADVQTVTIAKLDDAPAAAAPVPPTAVLAAAPAGPAPESPPTEHGGLSTRRQWAVVSTGAGVLGIGAGTIFGVVAISKHNAPGATCTTSPCSAQSTGLNNDAKLTADVSTVSFIAGGVGLALGAFLWFGDSSVSVSPGVGSLEVTGRF
jgi:hypothetical protein